MSDPVTSPPLTSPSSPAPSSPPASEPSSTPPSSLPPSSTPDTPSTTPPASEPSSEPSQPPSSEPSQPPVSQPPSSQGDASTPPSSAPSDTGSSTPASTPPPASSTNGSSSQSSGSSDAGSSMMTSLSTSTSLSTLIGTDALGQTFTSTQTITSVTTSTGLPSGSNNSSDSSSHVGAIVGGVVGGIGGAILLGLLLWFLRRRSHHDEFDGDFDPDRVVRPTHGPDVDLLNASEVTPYSYGHDGAPSQDPSPEMSQHPNVPPFLAGGIPNSQANVSRSHTTATTAPSGYSQGETYYSPSSSGHYSDYAAYANFASQGQGTSNLAPAGVPYQPSTPSAISTETGTGPSTAASFSRMLPSAKEREAAAYRQGGLHVANNEGTSGLVVHQDGGRVQSTPEEEVPNEIPPSYDSIPRDQR